MKLIGKIGQGTMKGLGMSDGNSNWTKIKAAYDKNLNKNSGHTMNLSRVHVRNGSRGNGIGMGHQIQRGRIK